VTGTIALIVVLVTAMYAVNAWKIRMVADGHAWCAASLEAAQGLLFVVAFLGVVDLTNSMVGAIAYVVGAFTGTAAAVATGGRTLRTECRCLRERDGPPAPEPAARPTLHVIDGGER